jgi:hypothetical protein
LRRDISAIDQQEILLPHFSLLTKHDYYGFQTFMICSPLVLSNIINSDSINFSRRKFLVGSAVSMAGIGVFSSGASAETPRQFFVEQGEEKYEIEPLRTGETVEEFYSYQADGQLKAAKQQAKTLLDDLSRDSDGQDGSDGKSGDKKVKMIRVSHWKIQ